MTAAPVGLCSFSGTVIHFCLTIKALFKLPLRQATGIVASLLKMVSLDWAVPDHTTPCRRQKTQAIQVPYQRADGPLNLLLDITGIKFLDNGEQKARKHGVHGCRWWRKVHMAVDTTACDIRAVKITLSSDGDSPVLQELLDQVPEGEEICAVTANTAYSTRSCHGRDRLRRPMLKGEGAIVPQARVTQHLLLQVDKPQS